jgi:hypothetical protein
MVVPPIYAGGVQLTAAEALLGVAVTFVGAPGGPIGVTLFEAAEEGESPFALMAMTVKV